MGQFLFSPLCQGTTTPATGYTGLDTDTVKVALFNNSVTPDKNAAMAAAQYGAGGTWTTGNEVTDASNWVAGGRQLLNDAFTSITNGVMYDADDLAGGGTVTISGTYGCLVYDSSISGGTVANQAVSFHAFGASQSVTSGTFTIVWDANGLFRITG
jgi:hypothetical protein